MLISRDDSTAMNLLLYAWWVYFQDDVIKWEHFLRYWSFVRGIHRWPVDSPHKGQWCGALKFYLMYAWTNGWANSWDAGDLRRHSTHCDVTVMLFLYFGYISAFCIATAPYYHNNDDHQHDQRNVMTMSVSLNWPSFLQFSGPGIY